VLRSVAVTVTLVAIYAIVGFVWAGSSGAAVGTFLALFISALSVFFAVGFARRHSRRMPRPPQG